MTTITVLNDLHLKPAYDGVGSELTLPPETDLIVVVGDLLDTPNRESVQLGRDVLERFDRSHVPTVLIPGNHDPLDTCSELAADFDSVYLAHERRVQLTDLTDDRSNGSELSVVGVGCTQFDAGREIPYETGDAFDVYTEHGHVDEYREGVAVDEVLAGVDDLVAGTRTPAELCSDFGLDRRHRDGFDAILRTADSLIELLRVDHPTVLASHVPPFGTTLDVHHSAEGRAEDRLHNGWMALSGAIRQAAPLVGVFGHSHIRGYDSFEDSETHLLNGGFRGVTTIELEGSGVGFSFHTAEWLPGES
ncbi:hypothetical protein GRX01_05080 [Halobaculum sp. WSA2]|uniref:Calcineurin-like phosphoesterase domain-containing protein n=1 Tax=Halobaculum saliterrae TaxID=2073113 RepID=A0A6B0SPT4_9EURY|nr:metallophosphoesterase [Halobaculum saliterrae]MXR40715.1 hypothetical protein [Halobaculum saliterrae]